MFTLLHKLSRLQPITVITYKYRPSNDALITKFDCNLKKFKFSIKRRVKVFSDVPLLDTKCCLSSLWKCPFGVHFTLPDKYFHFYFPSFRAKTICRNMACDSTFKRSDGQILVPKIQAKLSKNACLIDVLILFVFENRFKENLDINRKNVSKYLGP